MRKWLLRFEKPWTRFLSKFEPVLVRSGMRPSLLPICPMAGIGSILLFNILCGIFYGTYDTHWLLLWLISSCFAAIWLTKYFRAPFVLMAAFMMFQGGLLPRPENLQIGYLNLRESLLIAYFCLVAYFLTEEAFKKWVGPFLFVSSVFALAGIGPIKNTSLNAAFLVCLLPWASLKWAVLVPFVLLKQNGASCWILLLVFAAGSRLWWALPLALIPLWLWPDMLSESSRIDMWLKSVDYFRYHVNPWIGEGVGTYLAHGQWAQSWHGIPYPPVWRSLHSDWLQHFLETGIVGGVLGTWVYFDSVFVSRGPLRKTLILVGLLGLWYFPMRWALFEFLCVWCVVRCQIKFLG